MNNEGKKKDHTLQSLEQVTVKNVVDYFDEKYIKLIKYKRQDNSIILFAKHQYYSVSEIIEIFLVSVLIPYYKTHQNLIDIICYDKKIRMLNYQPIILNKM